MTQPGPLKTFATILRPSPAMVAAYTAILVWAGYLGMHAPEEMRAVYVVLLLCQSFSAATGFCVRARRGHFDPVLVAPASRLAVGLAHALVSTTAGIVCWVLVAVIEAVATGGQVPLGLTLPALAALAYMSAVAWAAALPFSRYSSGVVWLILAIALAGAGKLLTLRQAYAAAAGEPAGDVWSAAGAALIFPPLMVTEPSAPIAISALLVLSAAVVVAGIGVLAIDVFDFPLVDPS
jgi:hypothetical protein